MRQTLVSLSQRSVRLNSGIIQGIKGNGIVVNRKERSLRSFNSVQDISNEKNALQVTPWEKARNNGVKTNDLLIDTLVKQSDIVDGGYGRFSSESIIPANSVFMEKRIIDLNTCCYDEIFEDDKIVKLTNINQLHELMRIYRKETHASKFEILNGFGDFIASHNVNFCHINTVSLCANHPPVGNDANITTSYVDDYLIGKTTKTIHKGQELYQDYSEFTLPQFFHDFCDKLDIMNIGIFLKQLSELTHKKEIIKDNY